MGHTQKSFFSRHLSPLSSKSRLPAPLVVAADMMPPRCSILAPVEHLGHGFASWPALRLRLLRLLGGLRLPSGLLRLLLRLLLKALPVHRGRRHVVMLATEFLEIPRIREERLGKSTLPDLILADDMVPIGRCVSTSRDFAPTRLPRHPRHAGLMALRALNPRKSDVIHDTWLFVIII